jgi:hypothetical protein
MTDRAREDLAYAIGVQAYIWGYPVVINERRSRIGMASSTDIIPHMLRGPLNTFVSAKELLTPDFEDVQSPNNDTLYTTAWLDLRDEPMVMHVPDMAGRYYTYQFLDAYTNNFTYVSQRTRGFQEMDIAICGPGHSGALPSGLERIDAPTPTVFIIGRLGVDGPDDVPAVHALQDEMFLGPLSGWADRRLAAPRVAEPSGHTGPLAFFEDLGDLIADNPPPPHDAGLLGLFAQIGLTVDHGFDPTTLDEPTRRGLDRAVADGEDMIAAAAQGLGSEMNGWQLPPVATEYFGTDYLYRAAVGWQSMYVNDPIEAYYPPIYTDLDGAQLDGSPARTRFASQPDTCPRSMPSGRSPCTTSRSGSWSPTTSSATRSATEPPDSFTATTAHSPSRSSTTLPTETPERTGSQRPPPPSTS